MKKIALTAFLGMMISISSHAEEEDEINPWQFCSMQNNVEEYFEDRHNGKLEEHTCTITGILKPGQGASLRVQSIIKEVAQWEGGIFFVNIKAQILDKSTKPEQVRDIINEPLYFSGRPDPDPGLIKRGKFYMINGFSNSTEAEYKITATFGIGSSSTPVESPYLLFVDFRPELRIPPG